MNDSIISNNSIFHHIVQTSHLTSNSPSSRKGSCHSGGGPKIITVKKRQTNKRGNYILGETIGEGAFAKVKIATHVITEEKVAIKILDKQKLTADMNSDIMRIKKEINILKSLRHKNVIQLYEIMESQTTLYIVMEYCEGKELFDYIIRRKRLTEREACRFFQQIINGVEYLHLMNITHRDLKPENLLLDNKKRIKISDFGLSAMTTNPLLSTPCGTPSYAPPEMLRGDEYNGEESDIWSCGIILYTMLCGNLPCVESREELIYQNMISHNFDFPSYVSASAIDLINNMLRINPEERYTFSQIKEHPWFNIVKPQLKPGIVLGVQKIPVDENVLNKVAQFGYDKEECRESLLENKYDSLTAIYYLTLKQMSKEGKTSISDLFSETYVNYIKNLENWTQPDKINDPKYRDYRNEIKIHTMSPVKMNNTALSVTQNAKIINLSHQNFYTSTIKKKIVQIRERKNSLHLSSDPLSTEIQERIRKMLNDSEMKFNHQMALIDNCDNLPLYKGTDHKFTKCENPISIMANQLIKTTIFGKYLINTVKKKERVPIKTELAEKFYTLQKYKNLIEIIKSKRIGIFPKKIYDWNYYTFTQFLNDDEDKVFTSNFVNNNMNAPFIKALKHSLLIEKTQNNQRSFSKNFTARSRYASYDRRSKVSVESNYTSNIKPIKSSNKRGNKFISISSFISEGSVDKYGSMKKIVKNNLFNSGRKIHTKNSYESTRSVDRAKKVVPFKFKISTSTMNDISEDEEIFTTYNNLAANPSSLKNKVYRHKREAPELDLVHVGSNLLSLIGDKEVNAPFSPGSNYHKSSMSNEDVKNIIDKGIRPVEVTKSTMNIPINTGKNNNSLTGIPIDIKCFVSLEEGKIIKGLQSFCKKNGVFTNILKKKIKFSKVNLNFEVDIIKVDLETVNSQEIYYLKFKLKSGEKISYIKTTNEMLSFINSEV